MRFAWLIALATPFLLGAERAPSAASLIVGTWASERFYGYLPTDDAHPEEITDQVLYKVRLEDVRTFSGPTLRDGITVVLRAHIPLRGWRIVLVVRRSEELGLMVEQQEMLIDDKGTSCYRTDAGEQLKLVAPKGSWPSGQLTCFKVR